MKQRLEPVLVTILILLVAFVALGVVDEAETGPNHGTDHHKTDKSSQAVLQVQWQAPRERPPHASRGQVRESPPGRLKWAQRPRNPVVRHSPGSFHDWDAVALCESGGHWNHHTATLGLYWGGLQMTLRGWFSYHGDRYAPRPDLATKAQQIAVAEHWLRAQGVGAWPHCGRYL